MVAQELLRELFEYRDGLLVRKVSRNSNAKAGDVAGGLNPSNEYWRISIDGKHYYRSRLVYIYFYGEIPHGLQIDHIDRDRLNDKIENLRLVTHVQNNQNKSIRSDNKSGVTGVSWNKARQKYVARITKNGKHIHLGFFSELEDAIAARQKAEKELFSHSPIN